MEERANAIEGVSADPTGVMVKLDVVLARARFRSELSRDVLLGIVWALVSVAILVPLLGPVAEDLGVRLSVAQTGAVVAIGVGQSMLLALRRVQTVACVLLVATCQLALVAVLPPDATIRLAAPIVAAYTAGVVLAFPRWTVLVGTAALVEVAGGPLVANFVAPGVRSALGGVVAGAAPVDFWPTVVTWLVSDLVAVLLYLSAALVGASVAARREYVRLVESRADAAAREQEARLSAAIGAERSRMARELHDIAAHHLSGLVVQASAVERLVDRDPGAAKDAIRSIRAQGKQTLDNLRMVVGVLREQERSVRDAGPDGAPIPGVADLAELVASARTLGDRVETTVEGGPYSLPPIADVTAYRVAQEALANARQHAAGRPVSVAVTYRPEGLRLEVVNSLNEPVTGAGGRTGFGLVGMRERAALSLGRLEAGASAGEWRVRLDLPRPAADGGES